MAGTKGRSIAEEAIERFPELGCYAVAVRRIAYDKGMSLDEAIKRSKVSKSGFYAGMAGSGGRPTRMPSLGTFFAVAEGLGVKPEDLIVQMRKEAKKDKSKKNGA